MAVLEHSPQRQAMIDRMDEIIQEEVPWVMGLYPRWSRLSQPWVRNFMDRDSLWTGLKYLGINPPSKP